jgi:formate dehydrogenase iron-sulfur subunit
MGLDIKAASATNSAPPQVRGTLEVAKLVDVSRCIGCKACQAACMEWNDLRDEVGVNEGSYTNPPDLRASTWTLVRFREEQIDGSLRWLIHSDSCHHCSDPGCLRACPAPGAIVQYSSGIVEILQERCIACGCCSTGCPFDIPRFSKEDRKAYKCTLCSDRVAVGLEPACVKSCPTGALTFGSREDMLELGGRKMGELKERGFGSASVYDPPGVGGMHSFLVLPHGDRPLAYRLPEHPQVSPSVTLWRGTFAKSLGVFTMFAVGIAGLLHYMKVGRLEVKEDEG